MPATKAKTPDWAKVEAAPASLPVPAAVRPQPKRDDGVIHIVQGAAGSTPSPRPQVAAATPTRRAQNADTYDRREADPFDAPRKRGASRSGGFADPFADSAPAPRARVTAPPPPPRAAAPSRREPAAPPPGWRDPFSDAPSGGRSVKRTAEPKAPAGHPPGWKDPFSDATRVRAHHAVVALSDSSAKHSAGKSGGWGLLKKQSHR
jgi:hypothetical protein